MDRRWSCSRVAAAVAVLLVCQTGAPTRAGQWDEAPGSPHGSVTVPSGSLEDDLRATEEFLASRPLFDQPMGSGFGDIEGLTDISAASCGECHQAIAAEWGQSTHALAWVDRQFQAEISK